MAYLSIFFYGDGNRNGEDRYGAQRASTIQWTKRRASKLQSCSGLNVPGSNPSGNKNIFKSEFGAGMLLRKPPVACEVPFVYTMLITAFCPAYSSPAGAEHASKTIQFLSTSSLIIYFLVCKKILAVVSDILYLVYAGQWSNGSCFLISLAERSYILVFILLETFTSVTIYNLYTILFCFRVLCLDSYYYFVILHQPRFVWTVKPKLTTYVLRWCCMVHFWIGFRGSSDRNQKPADISKTGRSPWKPAWIRPGLCRILPVIV